MRLLALSGSILLAFYIVGAIGLTAINVSKLLFELNRDNQRYRFWARQGLIFIWPLVAITKEGRNALEIIWEGAEL